jgi:hypothetical protein
MYTQIWMHIYEYGIYIYIFIYIHIDHESKHLIPITAKNVPSYPKYDKESSPGPPVDRNKKVHMSICIYIYMYIYIYVYLCIYWCGQKLKGLIIITFKYI